MSDPTDAATDEDKVDRDAIAAFIREMRKRHSDEVSGIDLPPGTSAYVEELVAAGDTDTLMFMLKLGYLMGLQTGFAAQQVEDAAPPSSGSWGPLEA
ncbi:hypothetical protein BH24DEI2_BH24DEI2_02920 [soil metagenome]